MIRERSAQRPEGTEEVGAALPGRAPSLLAGLMVAVLFALGCRSTLDLASSSGEPGTAATSGEAEALLAEIARANDDYALPEIYRLSRAFLARYPAHAEADRVRYDLALQLVSENLAAPDSREAEEARGLLDGLSREARTEDRRFDAALLGLKFAPRAERERRAADLLARFAEHPDLQEVYAWLVEIVVAEGDTRRAAAYATELLARYPNASEPGRYRDLVRRASILGAALPLDGAERAAVGSRLEGRVVLVDFWATWCVPCLAELPRLARFRASAAARGFEILGVSVDVDREAMRALARERAMTWPILESPSDGDGGLAARCGVTDLPAYFVVDRAGVVRATDLRGDALFAFLEALLDAR